MGCVELLEFDPDTTLDELGSAAVVGKFVDVWIVTIPEGTPPVVPPGCVTVGTVPILVEILVVVETSLKLRISFSCAHLC